MTFWKNNTRFKVVAITNIGKHREKNQDNYCINGKMLPLKHINGYYKTTIKKHSGFVALFDGMGGESAGELASYVSANSFNQLYDSKIIVQDSYDDFINHINRKVVLSAKANKYRSIGSTVSFVCWNKDEIVIGNVGDSPIFRLYNGSLYEISKSHTDVEWLTKMNLKRKPALTQYLGFEEEDILLKPHIVKEKVVCNTTYLLCSDGLTDMVEENVLRQVLLSDDTLKEKGDRLMKLALDNGGVDNITIILLQTV